MMTSDEGATMIMEGKYSAINGDREMDGETNQLPIDFPSPSLSPPLRCSQVRLEHSKTRSSSNVHPALCCPPPWRKKEVESRACHYSTCHAIRKNVADHPKGSHDEQLEVNFFLTLKPFRSSCTRLSSFVTFPQRMGKCTRAVLF